MKKTAPYVAILVAFCFTFTLPSSSFAYWVWSPEQGKFINPQKIVDDSSLEQFNFSMRFYQDKNYKRAADEFKNLVKQFPKSDASAEALYYLGQIHELEGEYAKAFKDYQKIIKDYPQSERVNEVIEREFRIGDLFMTGQKEKLLGLPIRPSVGKAIEIFQKIVETSPYSAYGDQAQFRLAQAYRLKRDWRKAGEEYQRLIDNYPDSNLVDDAKFQMAESIALQASRPDRDQRSLELAAQNFEQFLAEYPNSPIAQKAVQLREVINAKAAEKNFKIGQYYEKENYLESALIYYEDVLRSYPSTEWAKKAEEKISKLSEPEKFLKQRFSQLEAKELDIEQRERGIALTESQLRIDKNPELERKVEIEKDKLKDLKKSLNQESSRFEKNKKESIKLRRKALDREKSELKRREKSLSEKRKLLKKNKAESLARALERWADSLESERYSLFRQETELIKLEEEFGIRGSKPGIAGLIPFVGKRQTLDNVIRFNNKDLAETSERLQKISEKRKELMSEREEFQTRFATQGSFSFEEMKSNSEIWNKIVTENPMLTQLEQEIFVESNELVQLEIKRDSLNAELKKTNSSSSSLVSKAARVIKAPVFLAAKPAGFVGNAMGQIDMNPFNGGKTTIPESEQFIEILREKENLEKEIEKTKGIVETIQTAFEEELSSEISDSPQNEEKGETLKVEDNKVVLVETEGSREVQADGKSAPKQLSQVEREERIQLKKQIKQLEREIRRRYEEIEDRKDNKAKKLDELANLLRVRSNRGFLGPVGGTARAFGNATRMFLFGMKSEEFEMSEKARGFEKESSEDGRQAAELKDSIELDNIMIEGRGREIEVLRQELDVVKAKAQSLEGFVFRSILIDRPLNVLKESIEEAAGMIPREDKRSVLINRLDEETRKLAELEARGEQLDEAIKIKTTDAKEVEKKALETTITQPDMSTTAAPFADSSDLIQPVVAVTSASVPKVPPSEPEVQEPAQEPVNERLTSLTQEMNDMQLIIENKRRRIEDTKQALRAEVKSWAQSNKIEMPDGNKRDENKIVKSKNKISKELREINKDIEGLFDEEKETLEKQKSLYEEKMSALDKAISSMKKRADDRYELLVTEKGTVSRRIEQTTKALKIINPEEVIPQSAK